MHRLNARLFLLDAPVRSIDRWIMHHMHTKKNKNQMKRRNDFGDARTYQQPTDGQEGKKKKLFDPSTNTH